MAINMTEQKQVSTGTTTLVLMCKNGIVMAADKRATAGDLIVDKKTEKIYQIINEIATTIAGNPSDAVLLIRVAKAELVLKQLKSNTEVTVREVANYLGGLEYQNIRNPSMMPAVAHFVLAGKDRTGFHIYDIFPDGTTTHIDDYYSSGSGSVFVYGLLDTHYNKNMTIDEGIKLAIKCVNASIQRDTMSGEGIDIAVIDEKGFRRVKREILNNRFSE